jgi:hypothetical protein
MQHNIETGLNLNCAWSIVAGEASDGAIQQPEWYASRFREVLAMVERENERARTESWDRFNKYNQYE